MKQTFQLLGLVVLLLTMSCGGGTDNGNGGGSSPASGLNLTNAAVQSTPQMFNAIALASISPKAVNELSSNTKTTIENFFKAECHNEENTLNFCPEGVEATFDTKFTTTTLIGLIQHADMYLANVYTADEVVDPETGQSTSTPTYKTCEKGDNAAELNNHTPVYSPANADQFIIAFGSLFDCVASFTYNEQTCYALYSKATDDLTFAGLTSRKQHTGEADYVGIMSDIFQSYLRRDTSNNPIILGFNLASFDEKGDNDYSGRSILITNISKNKFIVKYISGTSDEYRQYIAAIGKGGYNPTTASWVDGFFMVKAKFGNGDAETACVQNGEIPAFVDDSNCADVAGFFTTGWTTAELYAWLEASEADQTNLAGFNSLVDDAEFLTTADLPANNSDYYPDSISN